MEIDHDYYAKVIVDHNPHTKEILSALELVKKYISREKLIIVGGQAIDFAMRLKGKKLYSDDVIPDFDVFSPHHHFDAYEVAQWLVRTNYEEVSVINAMHPSTMRVRVQFETVLDATYVPENILSNLPTLNYKNFVIIHPHYQMIDQHRALSIPYENPPYETINHRWKKDMKRYDMLYELYPLKIINVQEQIVKLNNFQYMELDMLNNQCISGFVALNYWINEAQKKGFKTQYDVGYTSFKDNKLKYKIPTDSHGITLYTDELEKTYKLLNSDKSRFENIRFYNRFLDKLPRKIILDNMWELFDNLNSQISAHKLDIPNSNIWIANIQNIMLYLLTNYILLQKIKGIKRGYSFYIAYLICRDLVKWAADNFIDKNISQTEKEVYAKFLPSEEVYGKNNISESYLNNLKTFEIKMKRVKQPAKNPQPLNLYQKNMPNKTVPKIYYHFDPTKSELFQFDGKQVDLAAFEFK